MTSLGIVNPSYEPTVNSNLYSISDAINEQSPDILDDLAYETKMNVIAILEFILDIRLDFRISRLLSIFKQKFDRLGNAPLFYFVFLHRFSFRTFCDGSSNVGYRMYLRFERT